MSNRNDDNSSGTPLTTPTEKTLEESFSSVSLKTEEDDNTATPNKKDNKSESFTDKSKPQRKSRFNPKNINKNDPLPSFDATKWLSAFSEASRTRDSVNLRKLRVDVMEVTWKAVGMGGYQCADGQIVHLPHTELEEATRYNRSYGDNHVWEWPIPKDFGTYETVIDVVDGDCIECAMKLVEEGYYPAVLNMANRSTPGGGYKGGAGAQEENLFRRSNYFQHLEKSKNTTYPLAEFGGVYSPNVYFFRESEKNGYQFMNKPSTFGMIAVAAYSHPPLEHRDNALWLTSAMAEATKEKIRRILKIGLDNGHDSIVLSAFGCGAFANPPHHVALLFWEVIHEELKNQYKRIVFGIFNDHNAHKAHNPNGNLTPFKEQFSVTPPK